MWCNEHSKYSLDKERVGSCLADVIFFSLQNIKSWWEQNNLHYLLLQLFIVSPALIFVRFILESKCTDYVNIDINWNALKHP